MNKLVNLFKLLELTRSQPQYGYALAGIPKAELSDLAQHHYLVTFMGWQLCSVANGNEKIVDLEKVLKLCLVHDLGELFGGDLNYYYARKNLPARKIAKTLEMENAKFISQYFPDPKELTDLLAEFEESKTNEAVVAQLADKIECMHFKIYAKNLLKWEISDLAKSLKRTILGMKNKQAKTRLLAFIKNWEKDLPGKSFLESLI